MVPILLVNGLRLEFNFIMYGSQEIHFFVPLTLAMILTVTMIGVSKADNIITIN